MQKQNINYNPTKREQGNDTVYNVTKPVQSMAEQLVSAQLVANAYSDAANRKPPIPNIGRVPDRFGYRDYTPGISDVLIVDDSFSAQFGNFSGTEGGYGGTSYPSLPQL
jgi:hypothetical protein